MHKWSWYSALLTVGVTALFAVGCDSEGNGGQGASAEAKQAKSASESSDGGRPDDTFRYALADDPQTFDTAKMSGAPEGRVAFNTFEGLLMPAQTTEGAKTSKELTRPGVAKSYELSDDRKTYTFQLREDATWSNGDQVTAGDFRFAWKRILTPGFPADYAQLLYVLDNAEAYHNEKIEDFSKVGVEVVDKTTLKVELKHPVPFFPELVAFYTFFPQPKKVVEKHGEQWTRPENIVSNGAYTLEEYNPQQDIVLKKRDSYWEADEVDIEKGVLRIIKDRNAVVNAYKAGSLDWTGAGLPISQITSLIMHEDYFQEPMLGVYFYRINVETQDSESSKGKDASASAREALRNNKVRRALSLSIDRKSIVDSTMKGLYDASDSFVPSNLPGYSSTTELGYDIQKAKRLLKEAGYPNGEGLPEFTLLYNSDKNHKLIAENIANMWKSNLGVKVSLDNTEWKTYLERVDNGNYDIARAGWIGDYNDPMTFLNMWVTGNGNNDTGWSNEKYDSLIEEAKQTADPDKRLSTLQEAESLLMEKGPVIPIYDYTSNMLIDRDRIKGFEVHNRNIHLLKDLRIAE